MDTQFVLNQAIKINNIRYFKGITELTFNLDNLQNSFADVIKIDVDFNDGTPILIKEFNFLDKNQILDPITHKYKPSDTHHYIIYYPTIYITYSNFLKDIYQFPIRVSKPSFFKNQKYLSVSSCQFIDNSDNSMFVTLEDSRGDILNLKIK
jgi:hypothetical protein